MNRENINVTISRYILIISSFFLAMRFGKGNITVSLSLILSIIVLMQTRLRYIKKENIKVFLLVVQIVLIYLCSLYTPGSLFTLSALTAIDISFLSSEKKSSLLFALLVFLNFYILIKDFSDVSLVTTLFVIIMFLLFKVVGDERRSRRLSEDLYDRLRISEEKLLEKNNELELYANSIEEITRLRERNRISRELHDSVGHSLSTIVIQLGAMERLSKDNDKISNMCRNLSDFTKDSLDKVRRTVRDMKPDEYKNIDSLVLIDNLLNQHRQLTGKNVIFSFSKERWKMDEDQDSALYRVIEEFLGNSNKYGNSDKISVTLIYSPETLNVTLKDNGEGTSNLIEGFGLKNMRERISELDGKIDFKTSKGEGFITNISIPRIRKPKLYNSDINGEDI